MITIKFPLNTFTGTVFPVVDVVGRVVAVVLSVVSVGVVATGAGVISKFSVVIAVSCEVDCCLVVTPVVIRATVVVGLLSVAHTKSK